MTMEKYISENKKYKKQGKLKEEKLSPNLVNDTSQGVEMYFKK